jgi:hypothetical protein
LEDVEDSIVELSNVNLIERNETELVKNFAKQDFAGNFDKLNKDGFDSLD